MKCFKKLGQKFMLKWRNEKRKISELNPAEYNPRQLTDKQAQDLTNSLERFQLADPIVINKNNTIIGGHQRINILKAKHGNNGLEVDVRVPDRQLTDEEERELNVRLNKNLGEWDYDALANFDEEMLKDVGFDSKELDKIFQIEAEPEDDDVPEQRETDIKLGDMFKLGEHRLLCGDATKKEDVERLIENARIDLILTDPPYNIGYDYWDYIDNKEYKEYKEYCTSIHKWFVDKADRMIITIGLVNIPLWLDIAKPLTIGVWYKRNAASGGKVSKFSVWEPLLFYGDFKQYKRDFDVFDITNVRQKDVGSHTCPKQVSLFADIIENYTRRDDKVLDLFGGSGTTLIACEKLNRKCRMMEIDPIYCQVIIDRWEKFTGLKTEKIQ
jgi:DNA modification methylase